MFSYCSLIYSYISTLARLPIHSVWQSNRLYLQLFSFPRFRFTRLSHYLYSQFRFVSLNKFFCTSSAFSLFVFNFNFKNIYSKFKNVFSPFNFLYSQFKYVNGQFNNLYRSSLKNLNSVFIRPLSPRSMLRHVPCLGNCH